MKSPSPIVLLSLLLLPTALSLPSSHDLTSDSIESTESTLSTRDESPDLHAHLRRDVWDSVQAKAEELKEEAKQASSNVDSTEAYNALKKVETVAETLEQGSGQAGGNMPVQSMM